MSGLIHTARKARNGDHGLMARGTERGRSLTFFAEPAAPAVVVVVGTSPIPTDEFESFVIDADQPNRDLRSDFAAELDTYAAAMPNAEYL